MKIFKKKTLFPAWIRWLCVIYKHWQLSQLISLTPVMTNTFCTVKQSPVTATIQFKPKVDKRILKQPQFQFWKVLLIPSTHRCSIFKNPVAFHSLWFTQTTHSVPPSVCPAIESIFSMSIWWLKWKVGSRQISARRTPTNHIFHFKSRIFKRQWKSVFVHRNNRLITLTSTRHAFFSLSEGETCESKLCNALWLCVRSRKAFWAVRVLAWVCRRWFEIVINRSVLDWLNAGGTFQLVSLS